MAEPRPRRAALLGALAVALALAAGCSPAGPAATAPSFGRTDFSNYVALGTSVSMGVASAGLVDSNQAASFPALIAAQAGADSGSFVQPLVAPPGIPPLLVLTSVNPIAIGTAPGAPPAGSYVPRPARGYDNLGVGGALLADAMAQPGGTDYLDLVLQGHGTMVRQALARHPTFLTVELGANEALRPVLAGGDVSLVMAPGTFHTLYAQLLDSLTAGAPGALMAVSNVPPVTALPYCTTVPLDEVVAVSTGGGVATERLRDAAGPLPDGSLVVLTAIPLLQAGYGLTGKPPLPDSLVITVDERAAIEDAVAGYNSAIALEAQARGLALVDVHALYGRLAAQGVPVAGRRYTMAWPFGGLISLDGLHPTRLGSGTLANAFLTAINTTYGARIPQVSLPTLLAPPFAPALAARP